LRVVSENSPEELERTRALQARDRALENLRFALRQLTSNLLRVTAGAGKSYEIGSQTQHVINEMVAYREATGSYPESYDLDNCLDTEQPEDQLHHMSDDNAVEHYAKQQMVRGALRTIASRLVGQRTQEATARNEMMDGFVRLGRHFDEMNKRNFGPRKKKPRKIP
jgi:hypothetical protein